MFFFSFISGIGREVLNKLLEYGATKVYAIDISAMENLQTYSNVETVSVDLSKWCETRKILTKVLENVEVDGLVNNAGITICKPFEQLTEKDYDK